MRTTLNELLKNGKPIVADGGMGTILFALGLANGEAPELWNIDEHEKIRSVHRGYIEAGAQIILTNTFGGNRIRLEMHNLQDRAYELNRAAAELARAEADDVDCPVVVAGSMGPTGSIMMPYGTLEEEEAVAVFAQQAEALIVGGVDVLWIETMSAIEEVKAAVTGSRQVSPDFPIVATMTFDLNGHTMMGVTPEEALYAFSKMDLVAAGANCGNGTEELQIAIAKMSAVGLDIPLVAKANAGIPQLHDDIVVYDASPDDMRLYATIVRDSGATIIGACCGSTANHIRAIRETLS